MKLKTMILTTNPLFWLALILFLLTLGIFIEIFLGLRRMGRLTDIAPLNTDTPPVTIVVPACNEEDCIRPALLSLLHLDYANLEIIVINDRSTDRTDEILRDLQRKHTFREYSISDLPQGWLGKSHALHYGARLASGEYLLFTDADIIMERSTLSRAMRYVIDKNLDHLSLIFKNIASGGLLNAMILDAGGGLLLLFKPWKAHKQQSNTFMGVGAFNLVKKTAYFESGGHESIPMHPIDDIMLGKILKEQGFRQDCLLAQEHVTVRWYENTHDMISGLMKNVFSLFNFNTGKAFLACIISFLFHILPFWALFLTRGTPQILFALTVLLRFASFASGYKTIGLSPWNFPWALITPYINIYIVAKATITTLLNKGITWRGTHYPLSLLRKNRPIL